MAESSADLSPKQTQAIASLMTHSTIKSAAASCGVSYKTLRIWLELPHFQAELRRVQSEVIAGTTRALTTVMADSVTQLGRLIKAKDAHVRLGAVRIVSQWGPDMVEIQDVEQRVAALEAKNGKKL